MRQNDSCSREENIVLSIKNILSLLPDTKKCFCWVLKPQCWFVNGANELVDSRSVLTFVYVKHLAGSMYRVNIRGRTRGSSSILSFLNSTFPQSHDLLHERTQTSKLMVMPILGAAFTGRVSVKTAVKIRLYEWTTLELPKRVPLNLTL